MLRGKHATSVTGVTGQRSRMPARYPNMVSGNILIGEKAGDRITDDSDLALDEFVGKSL